MPGCLVCFHFTTTLFNVKLNTTLQATSRENIAAIFPMYFEGDFCQKLEKNRKKLISYHRIVELLVEKKRSH